MNLLLKDGEWISDKEVCYVLGQQLVNSCAEKSFRLLVTATSTWGMSLGCLLICLSYKRFLRTYISITTASSFSRDTCREQLCVDIFIYRQVNVVVLFTTGGEVAVNGIISWLKDPVLAVFQWLKGTRDVHYTGWLVTLRHVGTISNWLLQIYFVNNHVYGQTQT